MCHGNGIQDFTLHFCLPHIDLILQSSHGQTKIVLQPSQGPTKIVDSLIAFCGILIYFSKIFQQPICCPSRIRLYLLHSRISLDMPRIHVGKHLLCHIVYIVLARFVPPERGWHVLVNGFSLITRFVAYKLGGHIFVKGFSLTKLVSRSNPALGMKR